ncbi:MAG: helix-turn-helix transcriptional regulator [Lachnospiraceae bacterium]|nr:helix-turn-helix transcriptional regulator [Lachnospiraceae bacterium]
MTNEILLSNIRELCKKNNISVADLEKNLGIGAGTISRWNKANPSFDKIKAIAKFFKISIDARSGYTVESSTQEKLNEGTVKIIDYLTEKALETNGEENFWQDYEECTDDFGWLLDDLPSRNPDKNPSMNPDMSKLFYARDEWGGYLLEVFYCINKCYDCETQIRLYLVVDESERPVLECSDKKALQQLYIVAADRLRMWKFQKYAKNRRDELLKIIES